MNETDPELKTILVVDDDKSTCDLLNALLSKDGFEVVTAYDGKESLKLLKKDSYVHLDLMILDLMLPTYSGYSVLKEIQQSGYQNIPVLILTARSLDDGAIEIIREEPNVHEFWRKPFSIKDFRKNVHSLLGTAPKRREPVSLLSEISEKGIYKTAYAYPDIAS